MVITVYFAVKLRIFKLMTANTQRRTEIDKLAPPGLIVTRQWLMGQGFSRHALDNQVKSGQFTPLAPGVYARPHTTLVWQHLVCSLTSVLDTQLHLGGTSALGVQGYSHYLEFSGTQSVHLYGSKLPPSWVAKVLPGVEPEFYSTRRLWGDGAEAVLDKYVVEYPWREGLPPIRISVPELAILEVLMGVPKHVSFEHADELIQGLTQLSPRKLAELLSVCKSVKVKRLFFWLADRYANYPWRKHLDAKGFDLGEGKRVIAKGGKLNKRYFITVPEHMHS
jgi:hypothetical protein